MSECRRCGISTGGAIAGVLCESPHGAAHDFKAPGQPLSALTEAERDSLTECECGHWGVDHVSDGCVALTGPAHDPEMCACLATPDDIRDRAVVAIADARVEAAVAAERERIAAAIEALRGPYTGENGPDEYLIAAARIVRGES